MSAYTFLAVRERPDGTETLRSGLLYPIPVRDRDRALPEPSDGDDIVETSAQSVRLRYTDGKRDLMTVADMRATVTVTDARLVLVSAPEVTPADMTWLGVRPERITRPDVREFRAATARDGVVVGHLRYQWLHGVYAGPGILRLFVEATGRMLRVDLGLDERTDAVALGLELARRAATFRLAHDPLAQQESREEFEAIATTTRLVATQATEQLAGVGFPVHHQVSERSALLGMRRADCGCSK